MLRRRSVPFMLMALLAVLLLASAAGSANAQPADVVVGSPCDEAAFDAALATLQSNGGGTMTFNCGATNTIAFTDMKIITAPVSIDGGGVMTLNGNNATRLFTVRRWGGLTLSNLTLLNGLAPRGAAVDSRGSVTLNRVILAGHRATDFGGAVVSYGPLTIRDSDFTDNSSAVGGALYIRPNNNPIAITGAAFTNNRATTGDGGAIYLFGAGSLTLENCTFDNNSAQDAGGIFVSGSSTLTVRNCRFTGNRADDGGALVIRGVATVGRTTFDRNAGATYGGAIDNSFGELTLRDSTFSGNIGRFGGGVYNHRGEATLVGVTFNGNQGSVGGALNNSRGVVAMTNSTVSGNQATSAAAIGNSGRMTLTYVTIADNSARAEAGGIYHFGQNAGAVLSLNRTILAGNTGGNCYVPAGSPTLPQSQGGNLSSDATCSAYLTATADRNNVDARLGPLANNGGPTQTRRPQPGSPAIDAVSCVAGINVDQRYVARPTGPSCDIGAVETTN